MVQEATLKLNIMELSRQGKLARLYKWTYTRNEWQLPNSLCPYFWMLLIAVILFPITWVSYPFYACNVVSRFFKSLGCWATFVAAGALLSNVVMGDYTLILIILTLIGIVAAGIIIVSIGALIAGGTAAACQKVSKSNFVQETKSIISEKSSSFKDSYCPKINWK